MIFRICQSTIRSTLSARSAATATMRQQLVPASALSMMMMTQQPSRSYLGGAGEMQSRREKAAEDAVASREQKLWDSAQPRYNAIMERHTRLPNLDDIQDTTGMEDAQIANGLVTKAERELDVRKKRLIYRSKQRGWLEVDLLLGTWANENVPNLSLEDLNQFEDFVNMETIDIYNIITLRTDPPEELCGVGGEKSLVEQIQAWAKGSPLGKANKERYEEVKTKNNLI